jgi:GT2 family glycosyltransferase
MNGIPAFSIIIPTFQRNDLLAKCLECLAPGKQEGMELIPKAEMVKAEMLKSENDSADQGLQEESMSVGRERVKPEAASRQPPAASRQPQAASIKPPASCSSTYEVVVADDGRESTAEAMIRDHFPWARWVQGPGTGPAANRNAGAAVARGAWLAFTDDDCLPQPSWLAAYSVAIAEHSDFSVFEGKTVPDRPRRTLAEHSPVGSQGGNLWSCNFTIQRGAFNALGGFDPQFRVCMEDNDFALRVRQKGFRFPFIESALVIHPWRPRKLASDGWKSNRAEIEDHLRFKEKHPNVESMHSICLLKLGVRVFCCDLGFIFQKADFKGAPFALANLIQILRLAVKLVV